MNTMIPKVDPGRLGELLSVAVDAAHRHAPDEKPTGSGWHEGYTEEHKRMITAAETMASMWDNSAAYMRRFLLLVKMQNDVIHHGLQLPAVLCCPQGSGIEIPTLTVEAVRAAAVCDLTRDEKAFVPERMIRALRQTGLVLRIGGWEYDPKRMCLVYTETQGGYEVDIEDCVTSARALDWIIQVSKKSWATPRTVHELIKIMDILLDIQATLCPSGQNRRIENIRHVLEQRMENAMLHISRW